MYRREDVFISHLQKCRRLRTMFKTSLHCSNFAFGALAPEKADHIPVSRQFGIKHSGSGARSVMGRRVSRYP